MSCHVMSCTVHRAITRLGNTCLSLFLPDHQTMRCGLVCILISCLWGSLAEALCSSSSSGGRNKWRLHPYVPVDVRLLSAALFGLGAYYYYAPSDAVAKDQHQPNAGDGRIFGSPDSKEPEPLLDNGQPIPFNEDAVVKHQQRLEQQSKQQSSADDQHQPRVGNGRKLGSPDSKEPEPEQLYEQHQSSEDDQHQPRVGDGRKLGSPDSEEPQPEQLYDDQHQPNAGDGRVFGSPNSREASPEQLDNGEPLPLDTAAVAKHQQRLEQRSEKKNQQPSQADEQHQPRAGDGRKLGSPDSQEPQPEQLASGESPPLDLDAVDKHQQRLQDKEQQQQAREQEQHQPRVGDGRILGSPDSKEPAPVLLDNGEPLPVDEDAVARHQKRLDEKVSQRSARHENTHSDEFALSGDQDDVQKVQHCLSFVCLFITRICFP